MNSFKKLSIAIAAALAIGTLVGVTPASAATTLTVNSVAAVGGTTSAAPVSLTVPDTNNVLSANALNIEVDSLAANTTVTAVATNGRILTTIGTLVAPVAASAGATTVSFNTGSGSTASFYVFTTNTSAGTVSLTVNGNTTTYHFKGNAGAINTIGLSNPESAAAGSIQKVTLSAADIFGNAKGGASISLQVVNSAGTTTTPYTTEAATTATAVIGTKVVDIAMPASGIVTLIATASTASAVTGFATPIGVVVKTITVRDLASELAVVQAQLVAEKAARAADKVASDKALADAKVASDLALATAIADYKKKFNALAKKWNAKNPRAKVALIK